MARVVYNMIALRQNGFTVDWVYDDVTDLIVDDEIVVDNQTTRIAELEIFERANGIPGGTRRKVTVPSGTTTRVSVTNGMKFKPESDPDTEETERVATRLPFPRFKAWFSSA